MNNRTQELGSELKALVKEKFFRDRKINQKEAAEIIGIGESTISEYFSGKKKDATLYEAMKKRIVLIAKLRGTIEELEETKNHLLKDQENRQKSIVELEKELNTTKTKRKNVNDKHRIYKRIIAALTLLLVVSLVLILVKERKTPNFEDKVGIVDEQRLSELVRYSNTWHSFSKQPSTLLIASDFLTYGALQFPNVFEEYWKNLVLLAKNPLVNIQILLPESNVRRRTLLKVIAGMDVAEKSSSGLGLYLKLLDNLELPANFDSETISLKREGDLADLYLKVERFLINSLIDDGVVVKENCLNLHPYNMWMISTNDNMQAKLLSHFTYEEIEIGFPFFEITNKESIVKLKSLYNSLQTCHLIHEDFYYTASRLFGNSLQNPFGKCDTTNIICKMLEGHYSLKKNQAGEAYTLTVTTDNYGEYEYSAEEADLFMHYSDANNLEGIEILRNIITKDQKIVATVFSVMYEKWHFKRNLDDQGWIVSRVPEDTKIWFRTPEIIEYNHSEGIKEVMNSLSEITAICQNPASISDQNIDKDTIALSFDKCSLPNNIENSGHDNYVKGFLYERKKVD